MVLVRELIAPAVPPDTNTVVTSPLNKLLSIVNPSELQVDVRMASFPKWCHDVDKSITSLGSFS
jgi:hypothetical protein